MTSEAACRKDQFVIASPKAVSITYPSSEIDIQRNYVLFFRKLDFEFFEPRNPRQNIAHYVIHCYGSVFWTMQLRVRFGLQSGDPHKSQEHHYEDQKATEC
jgi:hypothetical protein